MDPSWISNLNPGSASTYSDFTTTVETSVLDSVLAVETYSDNLSPDKNVSISESNFSMPLLKVAKSGLPLI